MKWKTTSPKPGDVRTVRKFAWLPIQIGDQKIWLETFQTQEVYMFDVGWVEITEWCNDTQRRVYTKREPLYFHLG